jgi:hypothetical protein
MNIDKAIEYLDIVLKAHPRLRPGDFGLAVQLGKEALKAVKDARAINSFTPIQSLPGETKD